MANNSLKVSELPIANSAAPADRLVILRSPASNPSVRTITVSSLTANLSYANTTTAGVVKVGDNLSINATGHLSVSGINLSYANTTTAGVVKVGTNLTVNATGYLNSLAGGNTGSWTFDGTKANTGGSQNSFIDGQSPGGLLLYNDYVVTLLANNAYYEFNQDGTLTLPDNGDIIRNGVSVLGTGSWTFDGTRANTGGNQNSWIDGQSPGGLWLHNDYTITLTTSDNSANSTYGYGYVSNSESGFYNQLDTTNTWSWLGTNISDSEEPYVFIENTRNAGANNQITNRWIFDLHGNFSLPANSTVGSEGGFHIENATTISADAITIHNNIFDDLNRPLINVNALDINADGGTPATVFGPSDTVFDGGAGTTVFGKYEAALDGGVSFNNRHSAGFIDGGGASHL